MWKIQQLSELYIEEPRAGETCSDSNGTKALGLKYSTLPLAYRSPQLPFAFFLLPFSISLLNFTLPSISSFAVSYALMVFLLISLPAVPVFHLPFSIAWADTAPNPFFSPPISPFTHALTLSVSHVSPLNRDSRGHPGTLRNPQWGVKEQLK